MDNPRTTRNEKNAIEGTADVPDQGSGPLHLHSGTEVHVAVGMNDAATIPKGEIDPVYEAKARVLNRAACCESTARSPSPLQ
ncbi:hypothetical protein VP1G_11503 [Cytospora mali]|uniref:Uncharacterized protein n=1 Tax=Cytospora mali TaxID=578113 RepID=A0A194VGP8_CYTMA|nr:hypothetical protein VP1G_11503 [Valsa mali var. pyri (nom. inval.)]